MGVLPIAFFCSGHVYFTQRMHRTLGIEPYAVHATFQFCGTPGKRHRFREAQLWLEGSEYYHPPGAPRTACGQCCCSAVCGAYAQPRPCSLLASPAASPLLQPAPREVATPAARATTLPNPPRAQLAIWRSCRTTTTPSPVTMTICLPLHQTIRPLPTLSAAGFLTYVPHVPKALLAVAGPRTHKMDLDNTLGHFDLVNHQLKEVTPGLCADGSPTSLAGVFGGAGRGQGWSYAGLANHLGR